MEGYLEAIPRVKMRYTPLFLAVIFILPLISAETTFFDNPDDNFIMGGSATVSSETGTTGRGGCSYKWNCTNWGECLPDGKQTRNCINIGTCSDAYKSLSIEQNCTYTAPEIKKDKELEKGNVTKDVRGETKKKSNNLDYILFFVMITLLCAGCVGIFRQRKKIKHLIKKVFEKNDQQNNNRINGLIGKKVYTDDGDYIGKINDVILDKNRIHSLKIKLDKIHKLKIKGIILGYSYVKGVGNIVIIYNNMIETIRSSKNNKILKK